MVIITGTSRGIGKALAELYLANGEKVIGIGRTTLIQHQNYSHIFCDLAVPSEVDQLDFPELNEPVIFIHNAGILGEIGRFSTLKTISNQEVMQVNFNAGVSIFHQLIQKQQELVCAFVSSGAGKRPIPSWASYCASKAAIDLFLETVQAEEDEKENSLTRVYSFSPGVVDTGMQETIRKSSIEHFSSVERFRKLYDDHELSQPEKVAEKLAILIKNKPTTKVLWSANEIS